MSNVEYERPWLYPKQTEAFFQPLDHDGNKARYSCVEASTKAGKTTACIAWLFEMALFGPEHGHYWWVAPIFGQAKIAFRRMKRAIPPMLYKANETEMTITLITGQMLWFKSADKPDSLYGEDVFAAVIDEASRVKEDAWYAVRSTLTATRGPIRLIGNVKGRKNWFFHMCRKAEAGSPGMYYTKITAYDAVAAGVLAAEEIDDAKRNLPDHVFRELYLAEPSDDGGNPFGLKHIAAITRKELSEEPPVCAGLDLAKSIDWNVLIGLDRNGAMCGFDRWQGPWPQTKRRVLANIDHIPTLADSTGAGDPVVADLQEARPNVFEGYWFSAASKQKLMEGLSVAIQQQECFILDGAVRAELETFEYQYTRTGVRYTAPEGYHDDCVMALALAVEKHRRVMPYIRAGAPDGIERISPWLGTMSGG